MQRIDTYTLNKVAGWVLFTALLVFGLNELSHIVYHAEAPEQPGMIVEVAEVTPAVEDGEEGEAAPSIANLLVEASPEDGEAAARACQACHTFEEGGGHRVGPNLWNIVGAQVARHEDYSYSDALQQMSGETWTYEALSTFITNPREFAPGTKMTYGGMRRDEQRADLLAYLRTLSAAPEPLPEPTATAEEEEAAAEPSATEPDQDVAEQAEPAGPAEAQDGAEESAQVTAVVAGDPDQGQAAARQCQACHTFGQGEPHRVGPNLWNIVGARIAHHDDYAYSDALEQMSNQTWTPEALDDFIANPREFAPGTKMTYGGMRREEQRTDLIAYLASLSDTPPAAQPADAAPADEQETAAEPAEQETQDQTIPAEPQQGAEADAPEPEQEPVAQIDTQDAQPSADEAEQETIGQIESQDAQPSADQPEQEPIGQIAGQDAQPSADQAGQEPIGQIERAPKPEQAQQEAQVATEAEPAEPAEPQQAEGEPAQPTAEPVAAGDPERGQSAARLCQACHTFGQGEPHRVGPNLWGMVGAQIAHHEDYAYSDALEQMSDQTWTLEALDQFIANPREFAPGTKMTYGGMRREEQRADLLAYLRTLGGAE